MKRRQFVTLLGGAAVMSFLRPLAARAQQRARRIGMLLNNSESDSESQVRMTLFRRSLDQLGWSVGRNLLVDVRWANGRADRSRAFAQELVKLKPDLLVAQGTLSLRVLAQATHSIPIVFGNVSDPVGDGFVASLAHPGGNITGFAQYEYTISGKWLGLLKEITPALARAAVIFNIDNPASLEHLRTIEVAAKTLAVEVVPIRLRTIADIEQAVADFSSKPNGGLIMLSGYQNALSRARVVALAARCRLPGIYPTRADVAIGGLMSYGIDANDQFARSASYVGRILKGEKPADLPVQQPTRYELVINLKTAKLLGLNVPPTLSARADEVIE